ncbi:MAG TPA: P-loop NTPase fold protein, partial [Kofleriaceae bacterium]|nr:P-loop NTPase fold protein [Kofleriaceae bacterium]
MAQGAATAIVEVQLFNDEGGKENVPERTTERVSADLAGLFSYAHQWTRPQDESDACTLTFSSMLAAMTASDTPLCHWLQRHLGLRGVASDTMTMGRQYPRIELPQPLQTTRSFRVAFEMARTLCKSASPAEPVDVRHYMAAYAVCPQYHLADFLRLRIDRRAWCLELAEELATLYPEERTAWEAYGKLAVPVPVLAFNTDAPDGRDLLNIDREVEAFARLTAARTTITPLSVGVFGAWGSGKSFFMRRVRDRVARLAAVGRDEGRGSAYHGQIAQIEFNAWHYSEGTLVASLVDHIFRNLRIGIEDEDDATLRRRSAELIVQIDRAKQGLADREHEAMDAEARRIAAQRAVEDIDAKIPAEIAAKQRELEAAKLALGEVQRELAQARERKQTAVDAAIADAPRRAVIAMIREQIPFDKLASAAKEIRELVHVARQTGTRWLPIGLGVLVLGISLVVAQLSGVPIYARGVSGVTALAAFAVAGRMWLHKLDAIAKRGEAFQAAEARIAKASVEEVEAAHQGTLDALAATEKLRADAIDTIGRELDKLASSSSMARDELRALEEQRAIAVDKHAQAVAEVAARREALAGLSTGSLLGEFLNDRAATDGYRKQLTIFTQVRNDFERLAKLIARATAEYYASDKPPPTVSRIVLYVDDLDRCPEDKVIEVLRVVHLMLAFPLFVCFVAVDPRWVTQCLKEAPGLAHHDHAETGEGEIGSAQARDESYGMARRFAEELGRPA